jgi:mannose-6-phosphate isomerase-like protein (cupin superfamily)
MAVKRARLVFMTFSLSTHSQTTILPGMSYTIPPGHDAWVEGKEPFVAIEVMSAEQYAKPA